MAVPTKDPTRLMNDTQLRVINLLAGGWPNSRIAAELKLSPATVKWHVSEILSKLGMTTRTEAGEWWRATHGVRRRLWREDVSLGGFAMSNGRVEMGAPIVVRGGDERGFAVSGQTLAVQEWRGSAPGELHMHHEHDIAWHVVEGSLHFRFAEGEADVPAGSTLFVPAGTAHTYGEGQARYLVIGHPRLFELFQALRDARMGRPHTDWGAGPDAEIYRKYDSELLEPK